MSNHSLTFVALTCVFLNLLCSQRYSVDSTSRPDEANIPLSTMEPTDTAPQNGQSNTPILLHISNNVRESPYESKQIRLLQKYCKS